MILIADAGSTKIDWCVVSPGGETRLFTSEGVNALLADDEELHRRFALALNSVTSSPSAIYYYGAGCVDSEVCAKVERALRRVLRPAPAAEVGVHTDLLGAARGLCGEEAGIVCILGTGSNSGLYDGIGMADHVPSLGYVLGDEGSGASIGRRIINAAYRRAVPPEVRIDMERYLGMDYGAILRRVYSGQPGVNTFLASLVPFVLDNIQHDGVRRLVAEEFRLFFTRAVAAYGPAAASLPIHFIGGVAMTFSDVLTQTATLLGYTNIGKIEGRPMAGLISFHSRHL